MFSQINNYVNLVALIGGGIIVFCIAINFLWWLAEATYRQAVLFIEFMTCLLIDVFSRMGRYLKALLIEGLSLVFTGLWGIWLRLYQPCFLAIRNMSHTVRQYVKIRQLFWKYGRQEYASFAQFRRYMLGEEEPAPEPEPEKPATEKSGYAQALNVLGFAEDAPLDRAILKARHRELAAILHPDKEFPNQLFMQQVNDAVDYIKRANKWR